MKDMCVDERGVQHEYSVPPPLIRKELIAQMHQDARDIMPPVLLDCVMNIPQPFITPIYDFTAPSIVFGRVAMVGDAAANARPHMGFGVAKAGGDAEALARALGNHDDIDTALKAYNAERQPIGNTIAERLLDYPKIPEPRDMIVYRIRERDSPSSLKDKDIEEWNRELVVGDVPSLEMPVYQKSPGITDHRIVGILILDRKGHASCGTDGSGESEIDESMVKRLQVQLLRALLHLRDALRLDGERKELERLRRLQAWSSILNVKSREDERAPPDTELSHLETALLDE
jgi:hypothetical protein